MVNEPASVPLRVYVRVSPSASVAVRGEPMAVPDGVFSATERVAESPGNTGGASSSAMVTVAVRTPITTSLDEVEPGVDVTVMLPRTIAKLSGPSCSSSSRIVIVMAALVSPEEKVTVPELGVCSCADDWLLTVSPVDHDTPTVAFTAAESVTGRSTLEPSPTGESGPAMETVTAAGVAPVLPVPLGDHVLVPSSLVARTCTSYSVPDARPVSVVEVPSPMNECTLHVASAVFLYCTS